MKRTNFLNVGLAVLLLTATFFGCKKDDDDDPTYTLQVETGTVSDITATSATAFGTLTYDDKTEVLSGICWSTEEMPTIEDNVKQKGVIKGSYECSLTGLFSETTYYYRAFAQHGNKIVYGEQRSFTTIDGDDPGPEPGDGSLENPYNVAQAMQNQNSQVAWVKGYIVGGIIYDPATPGGTDYQTTTIDGSEDVVFGTDVRNTAVLLADSKDETDYTNCVVVNLPSGAIRAAVNLRDNPDNLGKELQVNGTLRTYFGISGVRDVTDYELEGGDDPGPGGDEIFSETFESGQGNFVIENVIMNDPLTYIWSHDATYKYMKASAYVSGSTHASEGWLISPTIDLTGTSNVTLTFEHAVGPAASLNVNKNTMTLWFSTDYTSGAPSTATWTQVTIPNYSTSAWTFVSTTIDVPAAMQNNSSVRFAYKYETTTESATWEIKNVVVK